eukprot:gb/GECG01006856.1/.p1 GENE.gb/GECG01006856.1/~~gb/GECG01006856.1/.p1  ORF type:complete len:2234 (+),score=240.06 gb/GECG01006856.1/:1-6702(+)
MQSKRGTTNYNAMARHHSLLDSCLEGLQEVNAETKKAFPTVRDSVAPALETIKKHIDGRSSENGGEGYVTLRENEIAILRENSHVISRPYTILWRQKKSPKQLLTRTLTHLQPLISGAALQPEDTFDVFTSIQKRVETGDTETKVKFLQLIPLFLNCFLETSGTSRSLWNRFAKEIYTGCLCLLEEGTATIRNTAEATLRNVLQQMIDQASSPSGNANENPGLVQEPVLLFTQDLCLALRGERLCWLPSVSLSKELGLSFLLVFLSQGENWLCDSSSAQNMIGESLFPVLIHLLESEESYTVVGTVCLLAKQLLLHPVVKYLPAVHAKRFWSVILEILKESAIRTCNSPPTSASVLGLLSEVSSGSGFLRMKRNSSKPQRSYTSSSSAFEDRTRAKSATSDHDSEVSSASCDISIDWSSMGPLRLEKATLVVELVTTVNPKMAEKTLLHQLHIVSNALVTMPPWTVASAHSFEYLEAYAASFGEEMAADRCDQNALPVTEGHVNVFNECFMHQLEIFESCEQLQKDENSSLSVAIKSSNLNFAKESVDPTSQLHASIDKIDKNACQASGYRFGRLTPQSLSFAAMYDQKKSLFSSLEKKPAEKDITMSVPAYCREELPEDQSSFSTLFSSVSSYAAGVASAAASAVTRKNKESSSMETGQSSEEYHRFWGIKQRDHHIIQGVDVSPGGEAPATPISLARLTWLAIDSVISILSYCADHMTNGDEAAVQFVQPVMDICWKPSVRIFSSLLTTCPDSYIVHRSLGIWLKLLHGANRAGLASIRDSIILSLCTYAFSDTSVAHSRLIDSCVGDWGRNIGLRLHRHARNRSTSSLRYIAMDDCSRRVLTRRQCICFAALMQGVVAVASEVGNSWCLVGQVIERFSYAFQTTISRFVPHRCSQFIDANRTAVDTNWTLYDCMCQSIRLEDSSTKGLWRGKELLGRTAVDSHHTQRVQDVCSMHWNSQQLSWWGAVVLAVRNFCLLEYSTNDFSSDTLNELVGGMVDVSVKELQHRLQESQEGSPRKLFHEFVEESHTKDNWQQRAKQAFLGFKKNRKDVEQPVASKGKRKIQRSRGEDNSTDPSAVLDVFSIEDAQEADSYEWTEAHNENTLSAALQKQFSSHQPIEQGPSTDSLDKPYTEGLSPRENKEENATSAHTPEILPIGFVKVIELTFLNMNRADVIWQHLCRLLKAGVSSESRMARCYCSSSLAELFVKHVQKSSTNSERSVLEITHFSNTMTALLKDVSSLSLPWLIKVYVDVITDIGASVSHDGRSSPFWKGFFGLMCRTVELVLPAELEHVKWADETFKRPTRVFQSLSPKTVSLQVLGIPNLRELRFYQSHHEHVLKESLREAFSCIQLINDELIASLEPSLILYHIVTLKLFASQTLNLNLSLTATGLLWTLADSLSTTHIEESDSEIGLREIIAALLVCLSELVLPISVDTQGRRKLGVEAVSGQWNEEILEAPKSHVYFVAPSEVRNSALQGLFSVVMTHRNKWSENLECVLRDFIMPLVYDIALITQFMSLLETEESDSTKVESFCSSVETSDVRIHHSIDSESKRWCLVYVTAINGLSNILKTNFPACYQEEWFQECWLEFLVLLERCVTGFRRTASSSVLGINEESNLSKSEEDVNLDVYSTDPNSVQLQPVNLSVAAAKSLHQLSTCFTREPFYSVGQSDVQNLWGDVTSVLHAISQSYGIAASEDRDKVAVTLIDFLGSIVTVAQSTKDDSLKGFWDSNIDSILEHMSLIKATVRFGYWRRVFRETSSNYPIVRYESLSPLERAIYKLVETYVENEEKYSLSTKGMLLSVCRWTCEKALPDGIFDALPSLLPEEYTQEAILYPISLFQLRMIKLSGRLTKILSEQSKSLDHSSLTFTIKRIFEVLPKYKSASYEIFATGKCDSFVLLPELWGTDDKGKKSHTKLLQYLHEYVQLLETLMDSLVKLGKSMHTANTNEFSITDGKEDGKMLLQMLNSLSEGAKSNSFALTISSSELLAKFSSSQYSGKRGELSTADSDAPGIGRVLIEQSQKSNINKSGTVEELELVKGFLQEKRHTDSLVAYAKSFESKLLCSHYLSMISEGQSQDLSDLTSHIEKCITLSWWNGGRELRHNAMALLLSLAFSKVEKQQSGMDTQSDNVISILFECNFRIIMASILKDRGEEPEGINYDPLSLYDGVLALHCLNLFCSYAVHVQSDDQVTESEKAKLRDTISVILTEGPLIYREELAPMKSLFSVAYHKV